MGIILPLLKREQCVVYYSDEPEGIESEGGETDVCRRQKMRNFFTDMQKRWAKATTEPI